MSLALNDYTPMLSSLPGADDLKAKVKALNEHCQAFKGADISRSLVQVGVTGLLFIALMAAMIVALNTGFPWATALMAPVAAGLLVRLFIIQHDCGHGSFFRSRRANDWLGRAISIFTLTPYAFWMKAHNMHHSSSGNLHRRTIGSIDTLTVKEYQALPPKKQRSYRLYRNPAFLLLLGTPFHVFILQRLPTGSTVSVLEDYRSLSFSQVWKSVLPLNLAIVLFYGALGALVGFGTMLLVCVPVVLMTAWIGGWLFFIQHQFEDTYWEGNDNWSFQEAAVLGSSYYALPKVLQWFSGNIGLHHIHHLCSLIPNYKLQECLDANPQLQTLNRMTFRQSLKCMNWALWDEDSKKMVGFRDLA